jgi:NADH:ubiquinone oxidoreductase subunit 4 (subunit M)
MGSLVVVILAVGIFPSLLTESIESGIEPIARIFEASA